MRRPAARAASPRPRARIAPPVVARACDRLLDLVVLAFAAWTVAYHVCVALRLSAGWAVLGAVLACALGARAVSRPPPAQPPLATTGPRAVPGRARWLLVAALATAGAGAALFGFAASLWTAAWVLWLLSAALSLAWASVRRRSEDGDAPAEPRAAVAWPDVLVAGTWAVGLAVFSLFLLAPDADDTHYVHVSVWVADHGRFPVRDVLFSDHVLPALYFPPVPSYEGLVGTAAWLSGLEAADVTYLAVPPVATALSVLALWRLLRTWRVPATAAALSVSLAFLLFAADDNRMLGGFFVSRMWQGKVLLLAVLIPVLLCLVHAYAERPTRRRLALLAAAAVAGVGLSTTAIFVLPVIVTAGLAPMAARAPRAALAGWLAGIAYPAGAAVLTLALGGRQPEVYTDADVVPATLAHYALGTGVVGSVALLAVLAAPPLLRPARAAQTVAALALAVGLLYAPRVPVEIFHLTDLGRVLWRLVWVVPVVALVGALAVSLVPGDRSSLLRLAPAAAIVAAVAASGVPLWSTSAGAVVAPEPTWKRAPAQVAAARAILARSRPGDLILVSDRVSQTIAVMSAEVFTVAPRLFFVRALSEEPAMHAEDRARLRVLVSGKRRRVPARGRGASRLIGALRRTGTDLACVDAQHGAARRLLVRAGFTPAFAVARQACFRAPAGAPRDS